MDDRAAIRRARKLIQEFTRTDITLWPILSEIELVLSQAESAGK